MNRKDALRLDMLIRSKQFLDDNAADFPTGIVAAQRTALGDAIAGAQREAGTQSAGMSDARFMFDSKATARENLREAVSDIAETARSMAYQFAGVDLKFRMPRSNSDSDLVSTAQAFATHAAPLENDFVAYGMEQGIYRRAQ